MSKPAQIIILDVGAAMVSAREEARRVAETRLIGDAIFSKSASAGIIALGTDASENSLATETRFRNMSTLVSSGSITKHHFATIQNATAATTSVAEHNLFDALVLAHEELSTVQRASERKIIVISNLKVIGDICPSDLSALSDMLRSDSTRLEIVICHSAIAKIPTEVAGGQALGALLGRVGGTAQTSAQLICNSMASYTKTYAQRAKLILPFNISTALSVTVSLFTKTMRQNFPTMTSSVRMGEGQQASRVRMLRTYFSTVEDDAEIPPDDLVPAYPYGPHLVPVAEDVECTVPLDLTKGLYLLGFCKKNELARHWFLGGCDILSAHATDSAGGALLQVLSRACTRRSACGLARIVRRDGAAPALVALVPFQGPEPAFYVAKLPFAEDLRPCDPVSFPKPSIPVQDTIHSLVDAMTVDKESVSDSADAARAKRYRVGAAYNPRIQRLYRAAHARLVGNPISMDLPAEVVEPLQPDPVLLRQAAPAAQRCMQLLGLDVESVPSDGKVAALPPQDATVTNSITVPARLQPADVPVGTPTIRVGQEIADFQQMVARRDIDLADNAVFGIVRAALANQRANQWTEENQQMLATARTFCEQVEEPELYNSALEDACAEREDGVVRKELRERGLGELPLGTEVKRERSSVRS